MRRFAAYCSPMELGNGPCGWSTSLLWRGTRPGLYKPMVRLSLFTAETRLHTVRAGEVVARALGHQSSPNSSVAHGSEQARQAQDALCLTRSPRLPGQRVRTAPQTSSISAGSTIPASRTMICEASAKIMSAGQLHRLRQLARGQ